MLHKDYCKKTKVTCVINHNRYFSNFPKNLTPRMGNNIHLCSVLVLVFVVYNRRREAQIKYPGPEDDIRENIINYEDEGGGEDDMTAFDITPLQIPIADPALARHSLPRQKIPCKLCLFFFLNQRHSKRTYVPLKLFFDPN